MVGHLRFYFGTMGSGKSTMALQIHYNLANRGQRGMMLTRFPREGDGVRSRLGVESAAVVLDDSDDVVEVADAERRRLGGLSYVVADEAQFMSPKQVEQLAQLADGQDIDVYAFGLLTDFRGRLFPGSARLVELADRRVEVTVESRCWCGAPAVLNARLINGRQVYKGDTVSVGDLDDRSADISYDLLCRRHWMEGRDPES